MLYGVFIAPCRSDLTLAFCDGASRPNSEVFVLRIVVMDSRQMLNRLAPRRMHHIVAASVLFALHTAIRSKEVEALIDFFVDSGKISFWSRKGGVNSIG